MVGPQDLSLLPPRISALRVQVHYCHSLANKPPPGPQKYVKIMAFMAVIKG